MRSAVLLPPDRRLQGCSPIPVLHQAPARTFVRKQIHLEHAAAAAGTQQRNVLPKAVLLNDIERPPLQRFRQMFLDNKRAVWRNQPVIKAMPAPPQKTPP